MANNKNIYYQDLSLDPIITSDGNISTVTNEASIKQSLNMIVNISRGSRIFAPDYGCRLKAFLFEPFDESTAKQIGIELQETITNYEKRVDIITINVNMDWQTTSYDINLVYRIKNTQNIDTFSVKLDKL